MIKIRYVLLFLFVLLSVSFSFSQNSKELEASFVKGGKNIEDVDYYLLKGDDAYLLEKSNNKIVLNSKYIKGDEEELKLLAKNKKQQVLREWYTKDSGGAGFMRFLVPGTTSNNNGYDYRVRNPTIINYTGKNSGR